MTLDELLAEHRDDLRSFLGRHAGWVFRYETEDDLLQGFSLRVLEQARDFEYRGREPALKWLYTVARAYLVNRREYWSALKRRSAALLRLTQGGTPRDPDSVREPAGTATGPETFAARREQLALAVKALGLLPPRDRKLVRWSSEGVGLEEQAARLGLAYDAAKQARLRALERYRKAYRLAAR